VITGNHFGGAFSYGIAIASAHNFTITNNILIGNTSFIGVSGPNCSKTNPPPDPAPFIVNRGSTQGLTLQSDFQTVTFNNSLICIFPPDGGDYWPFSTNPSNGTSLGMKLTAAENAGIAIGVILGIIALAIALWFVHKRSVLRKHRAEEAVGLAPYTLSKYKST